MRIKCTHSSNNKSLVRTPKEMFTLWARKNQPTDCWGKKWLMPFFFKASPRPSPSVNRYLLIWMLVVYLGPMRLNHCYQVFVQVNTLLFSFIWLVSTRWLATEAFRPSLSHESVFKKKRLFWVVDSTKITSSAQSWSSPVFHTTEIILYKILKKLPVRNISTWKSENNDK